MTVYLKTGQIFSKENADVLHVLEMNGLLHTEDNGDFGEKYSIPPEKLDEALNFLRDYFMVLGKK